MEERLRMLRSAMSKEKKNWDIPKRKDGAIWKSARPMEVRYTDHIAEKTEQAKKEFYARKRESSNSNPLSASKPLTGSTAASKAPPQAATSAKGSYVPPKGPSTAFVEVSQQWLTQQEPTNSAISTVSMPSSSRRPQLDEDEDAVPGALLQGKFDEKESSNSFAQARLDWLRAVADSSSNSTSEGSAQTSSASLTVEEPMPDSRPGALLEGSFDEKKSSDSFAQARLEWLRAASTDATRAQSTSPPVDLSTLSLDHIQTATQSSTASSGLPYVRPTSREGQPGFLLSGHYDEAAAQDSFSEARNAWLASTGRAPVSTQYQPPTFKPAEDESPDHWDVFASRVDIPSLVASSRPSTASARPGTASARASCYQCYKLFLSAVGHLDPISDKLFCSKHCAQGFLQSEKLMCSGGCRKRLFIREGVVKDFKLLCSVCASIE